MKIARIYFPVKTLGFGERVGIWTAGCDKRCKNCMSENLQNEGSGVNLSIEDICTNISKIQKKIDGFTISGGEPFKQIDDLMILVEKLSEMFSDDIIVFTGYTIEQLRKKYTEKFERILECVSVIIDGEYVEALNDGVGIRGSANQEVHIFKHHERHNGLAMQERSVQLIEHKKGTTIIGIP